MSLKGKAYIVGAYEHPTRKAPDTSLAQLHAEVAKGALDDAGLSKNDVDGYFCASGDTPGLGGLSMIEYMGLNLRHIDATDTGGSSYNVHVGHAAAGDRDRTLQRRARNARRTATLGRHGYRHRAAHGQRAAARRAVRVSLRARDGQHVRHGGPPPHAPVRHHVRAARLGEGRGVPSRAAQSACDAAESGDGRGGREFADGRRSAASARLLRHLGRRRRAGHHQARDRQEPEAPEGEDHRRRRGEQDPRRRRRPRSHLFRRPRLRQGGLRDGGREAVRRQVRLDLRQLHHHRRHSDRGPRLLQEGRGRQVRFRRQPHLRRRQAAVQHRWRRALLEPSRQPRRHDQGHRGRPPGAGRGAPEGSGQEPRHRAGARHGRLARARVTWAQPSSSSGSNQS